MAQNPEFLLRTHFKYSDFRGLQREVIDSIIAHCDTVALLPTGGGKSVCFQIPGLILGGTTIVVSPLVSLMKDQVDSLARKGLRATFINSSLSQHDIAHRLRDIAAGKYQFVYVAPERLTQTRFVQVCRKIRIQLVAIDEAHCISQWGHDFRPSYLLIEKYIGQLQQRPIVAAFTATATPAVVRDTITTLKLVSPHVHTQSFRRTNLTFENHVCATVQAQLFQLIRILKGHHGQSGIIYTLTRRAGEQLAQLLNTWHGLTTKVGIYHGGLSAAVRSQVQEAFIADELPVIVATNAFGMGIDKPNVRFVVHYQLSANLENYYQEAGRAGRDGEPAQCYLLLHPPDIEIARGFIDRLEPAPSREHWRHLQHQLTAMIKYGTSHSCLTARLLRYFGETATDHCHQCHLCLKLSPPVADTVRYRTLTKECRRLAQRFGVPLPLIMSHNLRQWWTLLQPQSQAEARHIPGVGQGWLENWGSQFLT